MGHGSVYKKYVTPKWLPQNIQWTMVDNDLRAGPDVVGDYDEPTSIGLEQWNYVVECHCPIHGRLEMMERFLGNMKQVLAPGGKVVVKAIPMLIRLLYPERVVRETEKKLWVNTVDLRRAWVDGEMPLVDEKLEYWRCLHGFTQVSTHGLYGIFHN